MKSRFESVAHKITDWLITQCDNAGLNGFVIGVSGGIDSAVVSTLCAMTDKPTIVVNMPIRQEASQFEMASNHIKWLMKTFKHVQDSLINLTNVFNNFEVIFPEDKRDSLSMANSRSRLRMTTLYAIANFEKKLVVGTGNKVEDMGVGFFTKYGDGGVDISPIGDLMKSEVRELGRAIGVNEEIIQAAPTDGLWDDGRTDEDQLGMTYDEMEWAMNFMEMSEYSDNGIMTLLHIKKMIISLDQKKIDILQKYVKLNKANQHKTQPIPICKIPKS